METTTNLKRLNYSVNIFGVLVVLVWVAISAYIVIDILNTQKSKVVRQNKVRNLAMAAYSKGAWDGLRLGRTNITYSEFLVEQSNTFMSIFQQTK